MYTRLSNEFVQSQDDLVSAVLQLHDKVQYEDIEGVAVEPSNNWFKIDKIVVVLIKYKYICSIHIKLVN